MMSLLMITLLLLPMFGIFDRMFKGIGKAVSRMFKPPTPKEVLQMRQMSGGLSGEGWELSQQFKEQYGTPLQLVAPVLSALDERLRFRFPNLPTNLPTPLPNLPALPLASQRLATLEQAGVMEQELQRQAQALQASGFRGNSLARALMGARLGTMMNRERMLADLALQEYMLERQGEEQNYQRQLQNYNFNLHRYQLELQRQLQEQQLREQAIKERFNLLMGLRGGFQEQAVKGGAMTMENILQSEQLASQQMAGLMQGIGALAGAYAQYRQNQEMLRTIQGLFQQRGAPASNAPPPEIVASAYRFFNPSRFMF